MLGAAGAFAFDTGFDGESDAGDFAAAGDPGQLAGFFPFVGGDEEDDGIAAVFGPLRFGKRDAESGAGHGQGFEFVLDSLFKLTGGLLADGGEFRGGGLVLNSEFPAARLDGRAEFGGGFDGPHFGLNADEEDENIVDGGAVFAFQLFDGREAGFDRFQAGGIGFQMAQIVAKRPSGFFKGDERGFQKVGNFGELGVDADKFLDAALGGAGLGEGGFGGVVQSGEGGLGVLVQTGDILQNAFFVFQFAVFAGLQIESFDFLALEGPEVGEAELFLLSSRDFVEFAVTVFPGAKDNGDGVLGGLRGGEIVENAALGSGVIELLLLVLAVDVAEPGRDLFEQGGGYRAPGGEGAGFAVGEDFAFDEEFVFFEGDAGFLEQGTNGGGFGEVENATDTGAVRAGADEIGRGSATE